MPANPSIPCEAREDERPSPCRVIALKIHAQRASEAAMRCTGQNFASGAKTHS